MRFSQDQFEGNRISACDENRITVNEEIITASVILTPDRIIRDWLPARYEALEAVHIARLAELQPEVILLGTGRTLRFPSPAFTGDFLARGIGVEIMDTQAACRTYNILLSEGRRVVAALLLE